MSGFTRKRRQDIIDGYLATTGRNMFVPHEFIDWLAGQTEQEAYPWFFGMDDAAAARGTYTQDAWTAVGSCSAGPPNIRRSFPP